MARQHFYKKKKIILKIFASAEEKNFSTLI